MTELTMYLIYTNVLSEKQTAFEGIKVMDVNWEELGKELVTLTKNGKAGQSSPHVQSLELALGADFFVQAVEHAVSRKPGSELARSLILDLKPWTAIKHCYEIFRQDHDNVQYEAYCLLRDVFDCRAKLSFSELYPELDPDVEYYADIIEMGVYCACELSQLTEILESALNHPNDYIRKQATLLLSENEEEHNRRREYLAKCRAAITHYRA